MEIETIAEKIKQAGGNIYLVGGSLRDKLLGKPIHDEDYCVTGLSKEMFEKVFPEAISKGKSFPVYDIEGKEFALARKEKKTQIGHTGFEIETGKEISIQEDLKRRDITINAMAQEVLTKEIIDPYQGQADLQKGIIRAVGTSFVEDPLRVYRVARFAASLQFTIEEKTIQYMKMLKSELDSLSPERVFVEFRKALATKKPSTFFEVLRRAEVLEVHFKEIYDLIGSLQPVKYHPEGDSYQHTLQVVDNSVFLTKDLPTRFACLVHDLGKGITPKEMQPHHYGHDEKGVSLVGDLAKRLVTPNKWTKCGKVAAKYHMKGGIFGRMTPAKQVDFITSVYKSQLGLEGMEIVVACDKKREGEFPKDIYFAKMGRACLSQVTGDSVMKKYQLEPGEALKERIRQERIFWIKNNQEKFRQKT